MPFSELALGANFLGEGDCSFLVWVPHAKGVELELEEPDRRLIEMEPIENGYFYAAAQAVRPGSNYFYKLNRAEKRPDPASRFQPRGVHGPSQVIDGRAFFWSDRDWSGVPLDRTIFYELHVGCFTPEGTFDAIIPRLPDLKSLGVTMIEVMPVAQFPGGRNWGYDGVYQYAVQNSYGGPDGLKRLVDACHRERLGVALDVVYNHFGPEGNYLGKFGPYFTDRYHTPWGSALNFDGPGSDEVRRFFIENALYWISEFHIDALRLDAIHAIVDPSAKPFIQELAERVQHFARQAGRTVTVIAESDRNDARVITNRDRGGYGLDAHWNDDFHHSLHAVLTGERFGYYQDFDTIHHMAKAFSEGFVYSGERSAFRNRRQGSSTRDIPAERFVVFSQNHDQIGNRAAGERLAALVPLDELKLAAGVVLLSPFVPLLFMGEEYADTSPFQYFISHSDEDLMQKVRVGRRQEFAEFHREDSVPDPQCENTFLRSKLHWELREAGDHLKLLRFYAELIRLRKSIPALANLNKREMRVEAIEPSGLIVERWHKADRVAAFFNFAPRSVAFDCPFALGVWKKMLDSSNSLWTGPGSAVPENIEVRKPATVEIPPWSFSLFHQVRGDGV